MQVDVALLNVVSYWLINIFKVIKPLFFFKVLTEPLYVK